MNWNQHMDSHYIGSNAPYNSAGSFMDFFAGLTYDHVNFIFSGSQIQDCSYSPINPGYYKFGYSELGPTQYYSNSPAYEVFDHLVGGIDDYPRRPSDFPSGDQTAATNHQSQRMSNTSSRDCKLLSPFYSTYSC
ncbi:E3 ubiquitin-protein ligase BIG BROTHER [Bienertia sinuspersici]